MESKNLIYLAGDIMSFGGGMARKYEYDSVIEAGIDADIYSPVMNKEINDKSHVTEEENNKLAEKITEADIDRLWNSDAVVICPEQSAIGTLCEMGCVYGWWYMGQKIIDVLGSISNSDDIPEDKEVEAALTAVCAMLYQNQEKRIFAHYYDIRNNHLNEKDWRRSFGINQLLYGMVLACTSDNQLHMSFDEIIPLLKDIYGVKSEKEADKDAE